MEHIFPPPQFSPGQKARDASNVRKSLWKRLLCRLPPLPPPPPLTNLDQTLNFSYPGNFNKFYNLIFSGNGFVILAVIINKKLRSATNALIVSLAFADLPVGVVIFPLISVTQKYGPSLAYGQQLCHITIFLTEVFLSASCLHLLFISVDRYLGKSNLITLLYACVFMFYILNLNKSTNFSQQILIGNKPGECSTSVLSIIIVSDCILEGAVLILFIHPFITLVRTLYISKRPPKSAFRVNKKQETPVFAKSLAAFLLNTLK